MVKRGIGAVVLAIIAALLLGYLLKDKSRAREDIVDMKLPGAPEITIPSLSDATSQITDPTASLVGEVKDNVSNAGSAVIDSASGVVSNATDNASNLVATVTDSVGSSSEAVVDNATTLGTSSNRPGFSFRPSTKNEEQKINSDSSVNSSANEVQNASESKSTSNSNAVVASTPKTEIKPAKAKAFKPRIENEPRKVVKKKAKTKKAVTKKAVVKKAVTKKTTTKKAVAKTKPKTASTSSKYAIQLLATSSQSRANKLAKTMNAEGYVSFITQTSSNNKILYRVRVGGHKDRNAALKAQESMKRRYQKNFSVQNSLVVSQ